MRTHYAKNQVLCKKYMTKVSNLILFHLALLSSNTAQSSPIAWTWMSCIRINREGRPHVAMASLLHQISTVRYKSPVLDLLGVSLAFEAGERSGVGALAFCVAVATTSSSEGPKI